MSLISLPYVFSTGNTIIASQHNSNFQTIYNDYNGNITAANIASGAGIAYSQLTLTNSIKQSDLISTFNNLTGVGVIPSGGIIMWHGTIASIPTGWFLCDGTNSTPDLRNQFVVCADADVSGVAKSTISGSAAQSGGSTTISINNMPAHTHNVTAFHTGGGSGVSDGQSTSGTNQATSSAGSGTAYTQPYYALAFIMKS